MKKLLYLFSPETAISTKLGEVFLFRELLESYVLEVLISEEYQGIYKLLKESFLKKKTEFSLFKAQKVPFVWPKGEGKKYVEKIKNLMSDIVIPETSLEIWKVTLLDDFIPNLTKSYYQPPDPKGVLAVLLPLYDTTEVSFFTTYYSFQLFKLFRERNIPVIGIETEKISSIYYYQYNFYDYYLVHSNDSREILTKKLKIPEEKVLILKDRYRSILSTKSDLPANVINLCGEISSILLCFGLTG